MGWKFGGVGVFFEVCYQVCVLRLSRKKLAEIVIDGATPSMVEFPN